MTECLKGDAVRMDETFSYITSRELAFSDLTPCGEMAGEYLPKFPRNVSIFLQVACRQFFD